MEPDTGIISSLVGHGFHGESSFHSLFLLLHARGRTKEVGASFLPHLMGGIAVRKHQNWRLRTKRELRISLENITRRQPHHEPANVVCSGPSWISWMLLPHPVVLCS